MKDPGHLRSALTVIVASLLIFATTMRAQDYYRGQGGTVTTPILLPDGSVGVPSLAFANEPGTGMFRLNAGEIHFVTSGVAALRLSGTNNVILPGTAGLAWGSSGVTTPDTFLVRDAGNSVAQKNGTNPQTQRWYFSTTGPIHYAVVATAVGPRLVATGAAMQLNTAQTTPPTCTTNCGTPGNVCVGTDTFMRCTMGTTPASGFVVNFNGTWAAAPVCGVQMALAGMVAGKQALTAVTTTTTLTVVTNGTAPVAGDQYAIDCGGLQ